MMLAPLLCHLGDILSLTDRPLVLLKITSHPALLFLLHGLSHICPLLKNSCACNTLSLTWPPGISPLSECGGMHWSGM